MADQTGIIISCLTKVCKGCGEAKAAGDFHRDPRRPDGLRGKCKRCAAAASALWYQRTGKERAKARQKHRTATEPDFRAVRRDRRLRSTFGLTLADFRELVAMHEHACAICKQTPTRDDLWHVDHDHHTGNIRGILCSNCNRGLGYFADDITRLTNAIGYLNDAQREAESVGCEGC